MSSTSTHDTKRSADVRARINVLSEMPLVWHRHVRQWRRMNRDKKASLAGRKAPDPNDEYLLYQTLVGAWPLQTSGVPDATFVRRVCEYMRKATREAKTHTNWANPNEAYEKALIDFVESVLASKEFCDSFVPFQSDLAYFGMLNSLSQTVITLTAPGVPDIYQGTELWDFSLVDPDNRRPVDYQTRREQLQELARAFFPGKQCSDRQLQSITQNMEDGRIKLHTITSVLRLRARLPQLFSRGEYLPLTVTGEKSKHVVAFARRLGNQLLVVAVPRLCSQLMEYKAGLPVGREAWQQTRIQIPGVVSPPMRNVFTGDMETSGLAGPPVLLQASDLLRRFPVAVLIGE